MGKNWFILRWLFVLAMALPLGASAQYHYEVHAELEPDLTTIAGTIKISGRNPFNHPIDTLFIQYWPAAYQKNSALDAELLENQNVQLHFNPMPIPAELYWIDSNNEPFPISTPSDNIGLLLANSIPPNDSFQIELLFRYQLPPHIHNGFGKSATDIRLAQWFPRIAPNDGQKFLYIPNNYNRLTHVASSAINGTLRYPKSVQCQCAATNSEITTATNNQSQLTFDSENSAARDVTFLCGSRVYNITPINRSLKFELVLSNQMPPPYDWELAAAQVFDFWEAYTGLQWTSKTKIVLLEQPGKLEPTTEMLFLKYEKKVALFEVQLLAALTRAYLEHVNNWSSWEQAWFVMGFSNLIVSNYAREKRPELGFLGPLGNLWFARFLNLQQYPYDFEKQLFYNYMARLGVDQPLEGTADQFNKANYLAVVQGKSVMAFRYLEDFVGAKNFRRGVHRWLQAGPDAGNQPATFVSHLQFYHNQDLQWWLTDLAPSFGKIDYAITKISSCSYTFGVHVKNKGDLTTPFSITGYKNGAPLITLWYEGFTGSKLLPFHLEAYDYVAIDHQQRMPEINARNNYRRTTGFFRGQRPLQLQLIGSVEDPRKTQIFWMPHLDFNAYDKALLGLSFHNITPVAKRFEYQLLPEYSTGTGKIMGAGGVQYRFTPTKGPFHLVYMSLYARYNHYANNLTFTRLSPTIGAFLRKPRPRDENIHKLRLRAVSLNRETPTNFASDAQAAFDFNRASYTIADFRYRWENVKILSPHTLEFDLQGASAFSRISLTIDKRWMLPNKKWLILRGFGGAFLHNTAQQTTFYSFGLSGTRDYLFDYALLGRTDLSGLWSRQFFVTDGGFKSATNQFANQWITTVSASVPIWKWVGVFGDLGAMDQANNIYWDYGIRISLLSDFLEVYLPIQNHNTNFLKSAGYFNNTRFILNIKTSEIIQRLRRGYY